MGNHDDMLLILINHEQKKHDQPQCYENHVLKNNTPRWLTFASCHGWWLRRFLTWCLAPFGTREALALSLPCPFVESIQPTKKPKCLPCICFTSSSHENKTRLTISLISRQHETHTTSQNKGTKRNSQVPFAVINSSHTQLLLLATGNPPRKAVRGNCDCQDGVVETHQGWDAKICKDPKLQSTSHPWIL